MASVVEICNRALTKLGQGEQYITALTDSTKEARVLNRVYADIRDLVLREHDWKCCIKRQLLERMPGVLNDMVYYSTLDMFIGVGDTGLILTSQDGVTWDVQKSGVTYNLNGVVMFSTVMVVVGDHGTILTSTDGLSWTARTSGTVKNIYSVCVNSTTAICAVGAAGLILSSTDYTTWTSRTSGKSSNLRGVFYGNSIYVTAGDDGVILSSTDLATWTSRTSGVTTDLYSVGYSALVSTTFIACGASGVILTSTDAATWTAQTSGVSADLYRVLIYTTASVTGACVITGKGVILSSSDFTTWTSRTVPSDYSDNELRAAAYSINSLFFFFGENVGLHTDAISTASEAISFTPLAGYDYQYVVPGDLLRILGANTDGSDANDDNLDWQMEGDFIYSDEEAIYARYIAQITDTAKWSIHLTEAVVVRMALEIAIEITGSGSEKQRLWQEYAIAAQKGAAIEYQNGFVQDVAPVKWTRIGR